MLEEKYVEGRVVRERVYIGLAKAEIHPLSANEYICIVIFKTKCSSDVGKFNDTQNAAMTWQPE